MEDDRTRAAAHNCVYLGDPSETFRVFYGRFCSEVPFLQMFSPTDYVCFP